MALSACLWAGGRIGEGTLGTVSRGAVCVAGTSLPASSQIRVCWSCHPEALLAENKTSNSGFLLVRCCKSSLVRCSPPAHVQFQVDARAWNSLAACFQKLHRAESMDILYWIAVRCFLSWASRSLVLRIFSSLSLYSCSFAKSSFLLASPLLNLTL